MFDSEIKNLKDKFNQIDAGLSYGDIGSDGALNKAAQNVGGRFDVLRFAVIGHSLNTMSLALDQVARGVEIKKHLFFHQHEVFKSNDPVEDVRLVNDQLIVDYHQMAAADLDGSESLIHNFIKSLRHYSDVKDEQIRPYMDRVKFCESLTHRFYNENADLKELWEREKAGGDLYASDQKPIILSPSNPKAELKDLYLQSALNTELVIENNISAATSMLAAIQLMQARDHPEPSYLVKAQLLIELQKRLGGILDRFDILEKTRAYTHSLVECRLA